MTRKLWHELEPGTVFRFDNKLYLRVQNYTGILAFEDFASVALHNDVNVTPIGTLAVVGKGISEAIFFKPNEPTLDELLEECNQIFNSTLDWEEKYERIFSLRISRRVFDSRELYLEYYDPDTTYEEDVKAFVSAFNAAMAERNKR